MTIIPSPCKDCKDRSMACHCSCEKYKTWKEELEKEKQILNQGKSKQLELNDYSRCKHEKIYLRYMRNS